MPRAWTLSDSLANRTMAVVAALIVLAPYATVGLAYRRALAAQAAAVLALTLAALLVGMLRGRWWTAVRSAPRPIMVGVALYGTATVIGAAVALFRGNERELLAGQLLAMGLLPLGAAAGLALAGPGIGRALAGGVAAATAVGCAAHLAYGADRLVHGEPLFRLAFPNATAATDVAVIGGLFALALAAGLRAVARRWFLAAVVMIVVYALIAAARSLWLAALLAAAAYQALGYGAHTLRNRHFRVLVGGVGVLGLVFGGAAVWWRLPRPNLLVRQPASSAAAAPHQPGEPVATTLAGVHGLLPGTYRFAADVSARAAGVLLVEVQQVLADGTSGGVVTRARLARGGRTIRVTAVAPVWKVGTTLRVVLRDETGVAESQTRLSLERLGPPFLGPLVNGFLDRVLRVPDPDRNSDSGMFSFDASLAFRAKESHAVWNAFTQAPWWRRLIGHGLGARFEFEAVGYDNVGRIVQFTNPNYMHNFYLFLLYKLGIVGALAVLGALGSWLYVSARCALSLPPGSPARLWLAAAAASWFGYAAWSVVAPEILDYRMAPLWGLLLAATAVVSGTVDTTEARP